MKTKTTIKVETCQITVVRRINWEILASCLICDEDTVALESDQAEAAIRRGADRKEIPKMIENGEPHYGGRVKS